MDDEQAVFDAVLKFVVLALAIGAVLGLVTFVAVKGLGVGGDGGGSSVGPVDDATPSALPTVALSDSSSPSASSEPSESPSEQESSTAPAQGTLQLDASPGQVAPGQRINLTGSYQGQDNVTLTVQRKDGGAWGPFADVTVPVRVGTFATYIITSRTGTQMFRVFDPGAGKGSNAVTVTVGG